MRRFSNAFRAGKKAKKDKSKAGAAAAEQKTATATEDRQSQDASANSSHLSQVCADLSPCSFDNKSLCSLTKTSI